MLNVSDQGSCLDDSVRLSPVDGPGSVQGLLGAASGPASDFQLPDGTVLQRPLSEAALLGTFADAWSVTPISSLLNDATNGALAGGTRTGDTMQFLQSGNSGQTVLQATEPRQVLQAAPGLGELVDAGQPGVTFQGTLADLANEVLAGFNATDLIDVTDLNGRTTIATYSGNASAGALHLSDGSHAADIALSGKLDGVLLHVTTDLHGGALIALS